MECRKEVIVDGVRVYEDKMKYATLEEWNITACKVLLLMIGYKISLI
jgi:hypothetical protein